MHFYPNQNDKGSANANNVRQRRPAQGSMLNKWTNQDSRPPANSGPPSFYPDNFDGRLNYDGGLPHQFNQSPFKNPNTTAGPFPNQQIPNSPEQPAAAFKPPPNIAQIWSNGPAANGQPHAPSAASGTGRGNFTSMNSLATFHQQPHQQRNNQHLQFQTNSSGVRGIGSFTAPPMRYPVQQPPTNGGRNGGRNGGQMPPMGFPSGAVPPPAMIQPNGAASGRLFSGGPLMMPNAANGGHLMNIGNLPGGNAVPPMPMNYRPPPPPHNQMHHPPLPDSHFIAPMDGQAGQTTHSSSDYNPSLYWKEPEDPMKKRQQETGTLHWGDPKQWNERPIKLWKEHLEESENLAPQLAAVVSGVDENPAGRLSGWDEPEPRRNLNLQQQQHGVGMGSSNFQTDGNGTFGSASATAMEATTSARMEQDRRPWGDNSQIRFPLAVGTQQQLAPITAGCYSNHAQQATHSSGTNPVDPFLFEDNFARLSFDATNLLNSGDLFR